MFRPWVRCPTYALKSRHSAAMPYVRFGSEADIGEGATDVRFTPKSGHHLNALGCPLSAKSGHPPSRARRAAIDTRTRFTCRVGPWTPIKPFQVTPASAIRRAFDLAQFALGNYRLAKICI